MKKIFLLLFLLLELFNFNSFAADFTIESSDFKNNTLIPIQYTCSGADSSPPLAWSNIPPNTQSLALVVNDPDSQSGEWIHWLVFNIPPTVSKLDAGSTLPAAAASGTNSWGSINYKGPCPPLGVHRYVFTLYALDNILSLENGASKDDVLNAMTGHVIGTTELIGLYQKL